MLSLHLCMYALASLAVLTNVLYVTQLFPRAHFLSLVQTVITAVRCLLVAPCRQSSSHYLSSPCIPNCAWTPPRSRTTLPTHQKDFPSHCGNRPNRTTLTPPSTYVCVHVCVHAYKGNHQMPLLVALSAWSTCL